MICKPVAEGAVLLHTGTETYFGLNELGREIWDLLPPKCSDLSHICGILSNRYPDVEPAQLQRDVSELLDDMVKAGLLVSHP